MLVNYWHFTRHHKRFLGFGFLMAFLSSPGQTYFIGVFGPEIQALFDFNAGDWGRIYMIGTLLSALVITWSGSLIDKIDLRLFTSLCLLGLCCACLTIAFVNSTAMLIAAIFLLRQFGQGLTSHTGMTSMARYHGSDRGKAIALAAIGFSVGEASMPVLAVISIEVWGWRETYIGAGAMVLVMLLLALYLLKGHSERQQRFLSDMQHVNREGAMRVDYTRKQMLSEVRFYLMLPALMAPALIATALFFFPAEIARAKQWSDWWVTGNYWVYSGTTVVTVLLSGSWIDRLTARKVVPLFLLPMIFGLISLTASNNPFMIWPYMILTGTSSGFYFTGISALWAELYGAKNLGAIKSLANAVTVFASALGPALVGALLNSGISLETICLMMAMACLIATALLIYALRVPVNEARLNIQ